MSLENVITNNVNIVSQIYINHTLSLAKIKLLSNSNLPHLRRKQTCHRRISFDINRQRSVIIFGQIIALGLYKCEYNLLLTAMEFDIIAREYFISIMNQYGYHVLHRPFVGTDPQAAAD